MTPIDILYIHRSMPYLAILRKASSCGRQEQIWNMQRGRRRKGRGKENLEYIAPGDISIKSLLSKPRKPQKATTREQGPLKQFARLL